MASFSWPWWNWCTVTDQVSSLREIGYVLHIPQPAKGPCWGNWCANTFAGGRRSRRPTARPDRLSAEWGAGPSTPPRRLNKSIEMPQHRLEVSSHSITRRPQLLAKTVWNEVLFNSLELRKIANGGYVTLRYATLRYVTLGKVRLGCPFKAKFIWPSQYT